MTARVPSIAPGLVGTTNAICAGNRVLGANEWRGMADAANWLLGKGSSLIVGGPPGAGTIAPGDEAVLSYYAWPHEQNFARLWCIGLMSDTAGASTPDVSGGLSGTIEIPSGATAKTWAIPIGTRTHQPIGFRFTQFIEPPSGTPGAIEITIGNDSTSANNLLIASVCCYELSRSRLTDFGAVTVVDGDSLDSSRAIYGESTFGFSVNAVCRSADAALVDARRAKLFDYCHAGGGLDISTTAYTGTGNLLRVDPPVMARQLHGETSREVACAVRAAVSGTGSVRLKSSVTLDTLTLNFSSSTPTWQTGVLEIATEDVPNLASNAGIRSATRDRLIVEAIATDPGDINVYGIAVGESG